MRKGTKDKKESNILKDVELTKQFSDQFNKLSEIYLNTRYTGLRDLVEPCDVVAECWVKVLRQGIQYDKEKAKVSTFAKSIVNSVCIDMWRLCKKHHDVLSLEYQILDEEDNHVEQKDLIEDKSKDTEAKFDVLFSIDDCCKCFNAIDMKLIIECKKFGLSDREISKFQNVRPKDIKSITSLIENMISDMEVNRERTLGNILYQSSDEVLKTEISKIKPAASFIMDKRNRFSLCDVIDGVYNGLSYKEIGKKLHVTKEEVKDFLDSYQEMVV